MSLRPCCCTWEWVALDPTLEPILLRAEPDLLCTFPGHRDEAETESI